MSNNRVAAAIFRLTAGILGLFGVVVWFAIGQSFGKVISFFTIQTNIFLTLQFLILGIMTVVQIAKCGKKELGIEKKSKAKASKQKEIISMNTVGKIKKKRTKLSEIVKNGKRGKIAGFNPTIQLGIVFYITITFLFFAVFLSGTSFGMGRSDTVKMLANIANKLSHYIVPVMAIFDWLLFMEHGKIKWYNVFAWVIYPLGYYGCMVLRAYVSSNKWIYKNLQGGPSRFPYPFIDHDIMGLKMIGIVIGLVAVIIFMGLIYIAIDKALENVKFVKTEKLDKNKIYYNK